MRDPNHNDHQNPIIDFINDPVLPNSDAIRIFCTGQLLTPIGTRIPREPINRLNYPRL
jgi:hypothetical protein